ncbi:MAG: hypothetical protein ACYCY0_13005, partial [Acidithiobacillus ferrivorans]
SHRHAASVQPKAAVPADPIVWDHRLALAAPPRSNPVGAGAARSRPGEAAHNNPVHYRGIRSIPE